MRIIWLLLLSLSLSSFLGASNAQAADYVWTCTDTGMALTGSSPTAACQAVLNQYANSNPPYSSGQFNGCSMVSVTSYTCTGKYWDGYLWHNKTWTANRSGSSCPSGTTYISTTGLCSASNPDVERCAALKDQPTKWIAEYDSMDAYEQNRILCTTSTDGCAVNVCAAGSSQCGTSGKTGKFACFGTGQYTGGVQAPTPGDAAQGCESNCEPPKPETTSSSDSCTTPAVANGVTSYTCHSESNSDQFASSDCAVGDVNGVTALHCTSPDYVPESNSKVKDDQVTEEPKTSGTGTIKTTDSTEVKTNCKAGDCSSTTTSTTTIEGKDANGNTTDSTSVCTGDRCDDPTTDRDESAEEEGEEVERLVIGEDCQSTLRCEGDAIDCAAVRQQKKIHCSMDWDLHKSAVLAEAAKSEYELGTEEVDASELFPGSSGRWLSASCPADRIIHLSLTNSSVRFSWDFVCQYAQALGNLLVALASLFFAVYVGRAFGGD